MSALPHWADSLLALLFLTGSAWLFGAAAFGLADRARPRAPANLKEPRP